MAFEWANDMLREKAWEGYRFAFNSWQTFAASANASGDLPDPPPPPED